MQSQSKHGGNGKMKTNKPNDVTRVMNAYVPLKQWATKHGHDVKHVRRLARNGDMPSAFQFDNRWYMPKNATDTVPEPKSRGTTRTDGRKRYVVYASETEIKSITHTVGRDNVINPRDVARAKRAERKLTENAVFGGPPDA